MCNDWWFPASCGLPSAGAVATGDPDEAGARFPPESGLMGHRKLALMIVGTALLGAALRPAARPTAAQEGTGRLSGPRRREQAQRLPDLPRSTRRGDDPELERPHNAFGKRLKAVRLELKKAGKPSGIPARLEAVADEDSDGDGVANLLELVTGHFPGEADDRPADGRARPGPRGDRRAEAQHRRICMEPVRASRTSRGSRRSVRRGRLRNPIDALHRRRARVARA